MTPKEELKQFVSAHGDNPRVWGALLDVIRRATAGESMESIAASYGISLEVIKA